jgi:hypothetical protein
LNNITYSPAIEGIIGQSILLAQNNFSPKKINETKENILNTTGK